MNSARRLFVVSALLAYVAFEGTPASTQNAASIGTDRSTYVMGETVTITGRDFAAAEIVTVQVTHADGTAESGMGHEPTTAVVGADGTFQINWTIAAADTAGPQLVATASGNSSGGVTPAAFTRIASVTTDKGDYQPGETAVITGHGFAPNEPVQLQVVHANGQTDGNGHQPFYATANAEGAVVATWFVDPDDSLGSKFLLTGTGTLSKVAGSATFWDAAIGLTTGGPYTQNFNTLVTSGAANVWADDSTLAGWYATRQTGGTFTTYRASGGTDNAGALYSFGSGTSAERALGSISSGTPNTIYFGVRLVNSTGGTITGLNVGYTGEQWRNDGSTTKNQRLDFSYQVSAAELTTGPWTDVDALDFVAPVDAPAVAGATALDGNNDANRRTLSGTITGLNLVPGAEIWLRWLDINDPGPGGDQALAIDDLSVSAVVADALDPAPEVLTTTPANGATNVATGQNVIVTFSEPVNLTDPWFSLSCATSGSHTAAVSGGPTSYTLNPTTDFSNGESCTLVIDHTKVSDQDSIDPPDTMVSDFTSGFTTVTNPCTLPFTPIYQIQGSGLTAAITGTVTTQGVVVGDFEGDSSQQGFFLQDPTGDGNTATSDGIFVFTGSSTLVSVGQVVRVTGFARERFNQTTINGSNSNTAAVPAANIVSCGTGSVAPTDVSMPFASANDPERFEGMLVRFPQSLVIAEYFNYDRFGELVLALPLDGETRPFTGTAIDQPGAAANARTLANSLRRITLDDANSAQNPTVLRHPNGDPFSLVNKFRGGDIVQNAVGVLGFDFSLYRIFPTGPANFTSANPRPASPESVGGTIRVAAMNTLNFFVTANYPTGNPLDNKCGPSNNLECRGWDSDQPLEFTRQRDKLLAALTGLNGDIIGLNELENTAGVEPLASIVAGLSGYEYIHTGTIGTDAIKVGLIYRPAVVTPVGDFKVLTTAIDPRFIDTKNRPSLAQTFEVNATHARFTVAVNHLKSKGSDCLDVGDPDLNDGQGNCSQTRKAAAEALMDWLATDPTGSGDPDFLILGDLNSYAREQTLDAITAGADDMLGTADDYTNLISKFHGAYAYSYTFDGQAGYLDHALASASMLGQVTGAADWHINSDEPDVLDYDTTFKPAEQDALYEPNAYRTSDHDPVVVGLVPNAPPNVSAGGPYTVNEGSSIPLTAIGSDPNGDALTYAWDLDNNGSFETSGQSVSFSSTTDGPLTPAVKVRATDPGGLFAVATVSVSIQNVNPIVSVPVSNPEPSVLGANVTASATFTDPGVVDAPFTCTVDYGDGSGPVAGSVSANSCTGPAHAYTAVGSYAVTISVTDKDGGAGSKGATHAVIFAFSGFFQPVDNLPVLNLVTAGRAVPVKFSLRGNQGLTIFAAGYPRSEQIPCDSSAAVAGIEETVTAGGSSLSYDATTGHYNYVWKTDKAWTGTCRQLVVKFIEGTTQRANFKFGK